MQSIFTGNERIQKEHEQATRSSSLVHTHTHECTHHECIHTQSVPSPHVFSAHAFCTLSCTDWLMSLALCSTPRVLASTASSADVAGGTRTRVYLLWLSSFTSVQIGLASGTVSRC